MLIKSRNPRLIKQLWQTGTLAMANDQLCDEIALLVGRACIHRKDFKLSSETIEIPHSVDREQPAQLVIMQDIFWSAMLDDMVTNGTTKFEIQLEPDVVQRSVADPEMPEKSRRDELKLYKPW